MSGPRRAPTGLETRRTPGRWARLRLSLTLAWRWSLREKGRSALIAVLVAIPVAGMSAVCLIAPSMTPTTGEYLRVELGHMQAKVQAAGAPGNHVQAGTLSPYFPVSGNDETPAPTSLVPAGAKAVPLVDSTAVFTTGTGVRALTTTVGRAWDPGFAGRYDVVTGTAPDGPGQVMVTAAALTRLGVRIGGRLTLTSPVHRTVTVSGVIDSRSEPDGAQRVFALPATLGMKDIGALPDAAIYLPDTTLDWSAVTRLNREGAGVVSRAAALDPPPGVDASVPAGSGSLPLLAIAPVFFAFGVLEVVLLAGAAFLVSARSRERALATLVSVGTPRSAVTGIMTASGLVLGLIGGLIGTGLGIAGGSLVMALLDDGSATRFWGYHLWWPLFAAVVAAAVLIGWLGALVPALRAARVDVVTALRGSRIPAAPRKRHPIIGLALIVLGILILFGGALAVEALNRAGRYVGEDPLSWLLLGAYVVGPIVTLGGVLLCSGLILRLLATGLARVGVAARVASRDTARNAGRSVPALAVVLVTVFVAAFAMTMLASVQATDIRTYQYTTALGEVRVPLAYWTEADDGPHTVSDPARYLEITKRQLGTERAAVLEAVPDPQTFDPVTDEPLGDDGPAQPVPVIDPTELCPADPLSPGYRTDLRQGDVAHLRATDPRCRAGFLTTNSTGNGGHISVGDAHDLALMLGHAPSAAAKRALENGGAVALYPQYVQNGNVTVSWWGRKELREPASRAKGSPERTVSIPAVVDEPEHPLDFGLLISPATAKKLDLHYGPSMILAAPETMPGEERIDSLNGALQSATGSRNSLWAYAERGPQSFAGPLVWGILGVGALISFGAVAVALALARADGRRDSLTLWSVGAGTTLRRGIGFWQALVLTGFGALVGTALGLVPPVAFAATADNLDFAAPWLPLALTALGLPFAVACGGWLFTRRRAPRPPRTAFG